MSNNGISSSQKGNEFYKKVLTRQLIFNKKMTNSSMIEDKSGNVWFGGDQNGGLWRYDGKSFTKFSEKDGLTRYGIWNILEDKNDNLWLGTRNTGANQIVAQK